MSMEANEAKAALGSIEETQEKLAAAVACPPWRHLAFGLIMAALVVQVALPTPLQFGLLACAMAGVAIVAVSDRRRKGMFVNGWRRGPTLPVSIAMMVMLFGLMFVASLVAWDGAPFWYAALAGAAAFVLATAGSVFWQRIYVRALGQKLSA
ncbi:MAG TPA: hypothetical protein VIC25_04900 [Caulobacteraceae bacterium]|jgi:hypothetical protein